MLKSLNGSDRLLAFPLSRFDPAEELQPRRTCRSAAGRCVRGGFCRIYPGQRILVGDQVPDLPGAGAIFQRQEKRFAAANLRSREQATRTKCELERCAHAGKRAGSRRSA